MRFYWRRGFVDDLMWPIVVLDIDKLFEMAQVGYTFMSPRILLSMETDPGHLSWMFPVPHLLLSQQNPSHQLLVLLAA